MSADSSTWNHKDEWRKRGTYFLIVVSRHTEPVSEFDLDCGEHLWCVYAYIFPKHPHFAAFDGPKMWQDAATIMPMHGGPSLLEYPMYDGKITSVKVGCDYNHLHDNGYTHCATAGEAYQVFDDADELFMWLQNRAKQEIAA